MTEQVQAKANLVTMENGEVKNFGERGRLLSSSSFDDKGLEVVFHIITGEQVTFKLEVEGLDELVAKAAIFGFESKAKAATAGVEVAKIKEVIEGKVEEFNAGVWSTRGGAGESLSPLTQIQTAYANANGIDPNTDAGIAKVNAVFAALTKEQKSALYAQAGIKVELAKLRLNAALALQA
jgi:hypothetical protein